MNYDYVNNQFQNVKYSASTFVLLATLPLPKPNYAIFISIFLLIFCKFN